MFARLVRYSLILVLILLVSCGPAPTPPPTATPVPPTATSTPEPETLEYVVIGDAFGMNTISQAYEIVVEQDLGVNANLYRWIKPTTPQREWMREIRTNTELRRAVKNADVILVAISPKWSDSAEALYLQGACGGEDNQDCLRETTANAKRDWIGFANTLADLREGQPVVLRVVLWGDWVFPANYKDRITPDQLAVFVSYFHEYQSMQASTQGIKTALAFPEEYSQLPKEYFQADGLHLSDTGSAAVSDLVRELGYEPAVLEKFVDLTITFTETSCSVTAQEENISNPIYIRVENPTNGDNTLAIYALKEGFGTENIMTHGPGLPSFVSIVVGHFLPGMNSSAIYEVTLLDNRENYLICAQEGIGALAVPLILTP